MSAGRKPFRRSTHFPEPDRFVWHASLICTAIGCGARSALPIRSNEDADATGYQGTATCKAHATKGLWADCKAAR